jgi:hypothetical protein
VEKRRLGGYFPFEYLSGLMRFLAERRDRIEVITYDDLAWGDDWDHRGGYKDELARWLKQRDPSKVYVLLQHDADSIPERTMQALASESKAGVPSNVMIFARRVDRRHLQATGDLMYTEYPLDLDELVRLETEQGFVVGYHINAFEQALWDEGLAEQIFADDVEVLRARFPVRYCSAHGGAPSANGRKNRDLEIPPALQHTIRWVHNGASPYFHGQYSDGGMNSPTRDPQRRNLLEFVRGFEPGKRYRVLMHPQYYASPPRPAPRLEGTAWYEEMLARWVENPDGVWNDVEFDFERKG